MNTKHKFLRTLVATSLFGGALMGAFANAAPVAFTVSGTVFAADGSGADLLGNAYTASFVIDSDAMAATGTHFNSDEPGDLYTAWYSFMGAPYGATFASSGESFVSNYGAEVRVFDDSEIVGWPIIGNGTYDVIELTGGQVTTSSCPLSEGCQGGEGVPLDGVEWGWLIVMNSAWLTGGALPSALPDASDVLATAVWATSTVDGLEEGNIIASVDSVIVSSVPEPEAWGLMLSGLALVGAAARRKRSVRR